MGLNYKDAGVDVEAGYKSVKLMGEHVKSTFRKEVLSDIGGFGGLFSLAQMKMEEPVLISGTDGVGTKLKLAFVQDKHNTVGIDCVAMCVNDIICNGAEPLFFLDYIACGKNIPEKIADIVSGVAEGCRQSGCALIGGETAEMPGFYPEDEYDMAGFAVGIVDKKNMITGENIKEGDVIDSSQDLEVFDISYKVLKKEEDVSFLTRSEEFQQRYLYQEFKSLFEKKDVDKLTYLYEEVFGHDDSLFDYKYERLLDGLSHSFDRRYQNLYEVVRLSYSKK